jgi:hypothetical protein
MMTKLKILAIVVAMIKLEMKLLIIEKKML